MKGHGHNSTPPADGWYCVRDESKRAILWRIRPDGSQKVSISQARTAREVVGLTLLAGRTQRRKEDRERKRIRLAPASMGEREVKKIAAEYLRSMHQGLISPGSATVFNEFVDNVYIPVVLPKMASSTRERYQGIVKNYLQPQFGGVCLRDVSTLAVDRYLTDLWAAKVFDSIESLDKVRDVLSGIMESARHYGLLLQNPVAGIRLPKPKTGKRSKPFVHAGSVHGAGESNCGTLRHDGAYRRLYGAAGF